MAQTSCGRSVVNNESNSGQATLCVVDPVSFTAPVLHLLCTQTTMTIYGLKIYPVWKENTSWCVCALMSVFLNHSTNCLSEFFTLKWEISWHKCTVGGFIHSKLQMWNSPPNYDSNLYMLAVHNAIYLYCKHMHNIFRLPFTKYTECGFTLCYCCLLYSG